MRRIYVLQKGKGFIAGDFSSGYNAQKEIVIAINNNLYRFDDTTGKCLDNEEYRIDEESLSQLIKILNV